ncbi:MAG TPA: DUF1254 domain-containing protein [Acetobacteraceae bacterium]|nr:DUF1254 domain-containing protein [Acetobacteraceae bacterium]
MLPKARLYAIASAVLACALAVMPASAQQSGQQPTVLSADQAREFAIAAYIYAYPLVLMEYTRRNQTNVADVVPGKAPMNQFGHRATFPDATFTAVVRPNADTLYSTLWFDVSNQPLLITVPDSGGRYYLLPMMDMWTDIFDSPGARTTGTGPQLLAIVGPHWQGKLPATATMIRSPTAIGWIIGRTETNGPADFDNVHKFQAALTAVPLGQWGKPSTPAKGKVDASIDMNTPPDDQVDRLNPQAFFSLFCALTALSPPHANDYPILHQMHRIGIDPGKPFSRASLSPEARQAISEAWPIARQRIIDASNRSSSLVNGWRIRLTAIGTYGTDYLQRASVAYSGLGANTTEDAVYPTALTDGSGNKLSSDHRYVMHFAKDKLPPVRGFWSLTMYNDKQLFAANPLNRYAIGDRDKLAFNPDGSLDLYVQRESPGAEKAANWLPAPASGDFTMNLRLYWPKSDVLDGTWSPPPVQRVD